MKFFELFQSKEKEQLKKQLSLAEDQIMRLKIQNHRLDQMAKEFKLYQRRIESIADVLDLSLGGDLTIENIEKMLSRVNRQKKQLDSYREVYGNIPKVAVETMIDDYDRDKSFFDRLEKLRGNPFDGNQILAIRYPMEKHLRLIAGAGSGKTETICAKAAFLTSMEQVNESRICMITFTRKAADEMNKRVHEFLGVKKSNIRVGTFHSVFIYLFKSIIKEFPALKNIGIQGEDPIQGAFEYKKQLGRLITKYQLHQFNKHGDKSVHDRISFWINLGYSYEEMAKFIHRHFDQLEEHSQNPISKRFGLMMEELDQIRKDQQIVVFDDYLVNLHHALQQSEEVRQYVQGLFDYLFIDEFQDTNPLQMQIVRLISPSQTDRGPKLIIVGDDDQSIYAFRGSDPSYIKIFDNFYPTHTVELMNNYRSVSNIVKSGNKVIAKNAHDRIVKAMKPFHKKTGDSYMVVAEDSLAEANWILDQVEKMGGKEVFISQKNQIKEKPNYTSSVILYRSIGQLQGIFQALTQRGIPYVIENGEDALGIFNISEFKMFYPIWMKIVEKNEPQAWKQLFQYIASKYYIKNDHIRSFLAQLDVDDVQRASQAFFQFLSVKVRYTHDLPFVEKYLNQFIKLYQGKKVKMLTLFQLVKMFPLVKKNLTEEEVNWIEADLAIYHSWEKLFKYYISLKEKKDQMAQNLRNYPDEHNALLLMTIHRSKGLSFDHVFIIGCYDGGLPAKQALPIGQVNIKDSREKAEPATTIEEERRLMYVAITRARKNLYITLPETRSEKPSPRSPFLNELRLPIKRI